MAQLAIKGHATRGKEVIEVLEMLGGKNDCNYEGGVTRYIYKIDGKRTINWYISHSDSSLAIFTLEEFLKKFPYKVGDKVKHAKINDIVGRITDARWDNKECQVSYYVEWDDETKSCYFAEGLQPYKEETMEERDKAKAPNLVGEDYSGKRFGYKIPHGYEFDCIQNNEIIIKPIKPNFPKTYEECCEVLFPSSIELGKVLASGYNCEKLKKFGELLICRDAYWQIADWKFNYDEKCYYLCPELGEIQKYEGVCDCNAVLAFPTKEVRDMFLENFRELINQCKELL